MNAPRNTLTTAASLATFEAHRDRLFGVAYRMTGRVSDANDICQESWLRWRAVDPSTVENAEAFLVRTTTRLAIDRARSASARHETYVGPDLPEPLFANVPDDPQLAAELADSMTFAFLVLLDELKPVERAILLLHDVFGYSFDEVALSVGRSPASCRQIASRTRRQIHAHNHSFRRPTTAQQTDAITQMIGLTVSGDIVGLMEMLAPDVVQLDDAGPVRRAARRPIVGADRVARFIVNLAKRFAPNGTIDFVSVNDDVGLLFSIDGVPDMVMAFGWSPDGRVKRIFVQMNPEKLIHLT